MVRKVDQTKINKILEALKKHPEGTYVSQISRETNLAKTTVSYLINTKLKDKIQEIILGEKGLFKILKLKT
ncbi:MAG: hypothetical protein CMH62_01105 [Nanoarchaeota archaeon]|nr:hypothetical protein [Nanoarchaeota archaeon]|tara:strand:- start:119 stop:331 length:213 start_codon:yes stop_codon:yes gene_type:complete